MLRYQKTVKICPNSKKMFLEISLENPPIFFSKCLRYIKIHPGKIVIVMGGNFSGLAGAYPWYQSASG